MLPSEGMHVIREGLLVPGSDASAVGVVVPGTAVSAWQPMPANWSTVDAGNGALAVGFGSNLSVDALHPSPETVAAVQRMKDQVINEFVDSKIKEAQIRNSQEDAYLKVHAQLRDLGFDVEPTATETVVNLVMALIQDDRASVLESVSDDKLIREIFRRYPSDLVSNLPDIELKVHSLDTFQDIPTLTPTVDIRVKVPRT